MFFIFGWIKENKDVGRSVRCYCYRCQARREWEHWRQTEWVSFFLVKVIPLINKNVLVCGGCREPVAIDGAKARQLGNAASHDALARHLEDRQLAQKSDIQKRFLQARREQAESQRSDRDGSPR